MDICDTRSAGRLSPDHQAKIDGARPAIIADTGQIVSFADLSSRSMQVAQLLHRRGFRVGDHIAIVSENHPAVFEIVLGALRSGLYVTPINWHLKVSEAAYIVSNCEATGLFASAKHAELACRMRAAAPRIRHAFAFGGNADGFEPYEELLKREPAEALELETEGSMMFYSSGTTGVPKGIIRPLSGETFGTGTNIDRDYVGQMWGELGEDVVHFNPGPIYHAASLAWSIAFIRHGRTLALMEKFDALESLALIERLQVTHAHFVPTHFIRMLKLDPILRERFDMSSLRVVQHAAAPCPVEVKQQMFEWWGPIIYEYCGGSEDIVYASIGPQEWLEHIGSVGRPAAGKVHVLDEEGHELPAGEAGTLWVENVKPFEYFKEPEKTAAVFNARGWATLGDVGYLDDDGYLFMKDRRPHLILSGGVNIYPQEVEDVLVGHESVFDVGVIGVPNEEFGEEVKAIVVVKDGARGDGALEAELIDYCRSRLAHFKCPRSVDFVDSLPRTEAGKLRKHLLQEPYWETH